jgi:hypothetical protein
MDRKIYEEPDLVTPPMRYSPYRNYDVNIWSLESGVLNITAYQLSVDKDDPEEILGTDYDADYFTESFCLSDEADHKMLDYLLCYKLGMPDWSALGDLDEWTTYLGNTSDYVNDLVNKSGGIAPIKLVKWLDSLPAYEPNLI